MEHKHDNPVVGLAYARVHKSIIYATTRWAKTIHQHVGPQQSIKKTQQVEWQQHLNNRQLIFLVALRLALQQLLV